DTSTTNPNTSQIEVSAGTYDVTESVPSGWDLSSIACDDGDSTHSGNTATYRVEAGETVTCTFTDTKHGQLIIKKATSGGDDTFSFTSSDVAGGPFSVPTSGGTGQYPGIEVSANTTTGYTVTEASPPTDWDFDSVSCDNPDGLHPSTTSAQSATFKVDPGETVTCTWSNIKRGHIIVNKVTDPSGGSDSFHFTTSGAGYTGFDLSDGDQNDQALTPGSYGVAETPASGWDTAADCADQD